MTEPTRSSELFHPQLTQALKEVAANEELCSEAGYFIEYDLQAGGVNTIFAQMYSAEQVITAAKSIDSLIAATELMVKESREAAASSRRFGWASLAVAIASAGAAITSVILIINSTPS